MQPSHRPVFWSLLALSGSLFLYGCRSYGDPYSVPANSASWAASKNAARQDLSAIPPPSKDVYLSIHEEPQWQNPFLTVERNMIQLRIYLRDENTSQFDQGGLTRTRAARRLVLNVRLSDLPKALDSLPTNAWPYGRVVAVQYNMKTSQHNANVRHNVEVTFQTLNDLGLVVDDWNSTGLQ